MTDWDWLTVSIQTQRQVYWRPCSSQPASKNSNWCRRRYPRTARVGLVNDQVNERSHMRSHSLTCVEQSSLYIDWPSALQWQTRRLLWCVNYVMGM